MYPRPPSMRLGFSCHQCVVCHTAPGLVAPGSGVMCSCQPGAGRARCVRSTPGSVFCVGSFKLGKCVPESLYGQADVCSASTVSDAHIMYAEYVLRYNRLSHIITITHFASSCLPTCGLHHHPDARGASTASPAVLRCQARQRPSVSFCYLIRHHKACAKA